MPIVRHRNTLQKGSARFIIFREGKTWYGACLEFNIVESGDTPREANLLLLEAMQGYVESARKIKARPHILNQKTDAEYERMWDAAEARRTIPSKEIFSFGTLNLSRRAFAAV